MDYFHIIPIIYYVGCSGHKKRKQLNREKTFIKNYGVSNPMKSKKIVNQLKQNNIDKFGVDNPMKVEEIKEKQKNTILDKFGVDNPMKNKTIALKSAKSNNNSEILYHWKTNEELICVGSFEIETIKFLNENKIDFDWQILFQMPNGRVYIVDCYLPEEDLYIEIKGYFRKDAQEKWDWFHKEYPNSELWDKKKLKELKIL